MLDSRLRKWLENNNVLSECQFGFRNKKSTTDCIFVLISLINRVVYQKKRQLCCAFVDFKKAFDLVYRNGILYKLLLNNVSSKFVTMIQSIYSCVKTCVKTNRVGNSSDASQNAYGANHSHNSTINNIGISPIRFI